MVTWDKDKLLDRVQEILITNFVGVTVTNRNNAYDKIGVVIPVAEVKVETPDPNDSGVVEKVTVDFGSIKCEYQFIWNVCSVGKPVKFRLVKIQPLQEVFNK